MTPKRILKYKRTFKGWAYQLICDMKKSCKRRNHKLPEFTRNELCEWLLKNYPNEVEEIFEAWKASGYTREKHPSIDRIDDKKSYTFDNIVFTDWKTNKLKGDLDKRVSIKQLSKNGELVNIFSSIKSAAQSINKHPAGISCTLDKYNKTYYGFKWKRLYTK